jgi:hypothetical protein
MTLAGENRSAQRETCPTVTLFHTQTDPESRPGLRGKRAANNHFGHGTAFHYDTHLNTI